MRVVFIGSVIFSRIALEKLFQMNTQIVGIITKSESKFNADFDDISDLAIKNKLPFKYVNNINHIENVKWIQEKKPDVIFCFGWSSLLKIEVLSLSKLGVVGFHPSLLPSNRGRHPLIWAKVLGLSKTGTTFFFMDENADTGDIISQKQYSISFEDTANVIYQKMIDSAIEQIDEFLPKLISGNYEVIKQTTEGNNWRKRDASDGFIDFRMNSVPICNLVRALSKPYPGAHCSYKGQDVKVWKIVLGNDVRNNLEPGKVISISQNCIEIKTADSSVIITEHEFKELPQLNEYIR
jgi:methionyl-tRNA formyltransferase